MKKNKKILLTILMLLTLTFTVSVTTQAASSTVAKIGNKKYTSLQKAINAVKNGQTIKVTKNISTRKFFAAEIDKPGMSFTIDFQNHTYKATDKNYLLYIMAGNVTLKNAKFNGYTHSRSLIYVQKGAKLTIKNGTYKKIAIENDGFLTINGGTFVEGTPGDSGLQDIGIIFSTKSLKITGGTFMGRTVNCNGGKASITGGTFTYTLNERTIQNSSSSTLTISGGKFTNKYCVLQNSGTLTVTGGTFSSTSKGASLIYLKGGSMTKLKGGTFIGKSGSHLYCKFNGYAFIDITKAKIKTPYLGKE